ncbi:MAG: diguanylate cyclase [Actinomycetes bacterium]
MSDRQRSADVIDVQAARFRVFSIIAIAASLLGVGLGAIDALWGISIAAGLTAVLVGCCYLWARSAPQRANQGMAISLYGATLGLGIMSFSELPNASTMPFFMAIVVLAGSYLLGNRAALILTIVASIMIIICYVGFAWAAALGLVPGTGYAMVGDADVLELLIMALRRIMFLFAVFGIATAARMALDKQLAVIQQREEVISAQSADLRASQRQFLTVADNVPVGILQTDQSGRAVFANRSWCELVSSSEADTLGQGWHACVYPEDLPMLLELMPAAEPESSPTVAEAPEYPFRLRRADGEVRWVNGRIAPLKNEDGSVAGYLMAAIDVTDARTASEQLKYLATHDPMTGILNRAAFEIEVSSALARAERYTNRCALLFADIDDFKVINDTFGHAVGDMALDTLVRRIQTTLRDVDTVGRLGGDEFGILMDQVRTREDALLTIHHIEAVLREPIIVAEGQSFQLRLSIGAAVYPEDGVDFDDLSRRADAAMYQEKARRYSHEKPIQA